MVSRPEDQKHYTLKIENPVVETTGFNQNQVLMKKE
jgi:hypothetical protein